MALFDQSSDLFSPHVLDAFNHGSDMVNILDVVCGLTEKDIADFKEFVALQIC